MVGLYVVHVVNEAEVAEEDVGMTNLLTGPEIGERSNVSGGATATNVGDINTDHDVEKDLDGVETVVESNFDSNEEGIPKEDDSKVDEELRSVKDEKRSKKRNKQQRKKPIAKNEIPLGEADSDDNKDELDLEAVAGVDLPGRRRNIKL
ncbi:hypothetical protein HAX54_022301, partial [Datura stramonium]|nr:hypothetical protein [Datura stramonium]